MRYIHLNPLRARLVGSLEALAQYPYAGHSALLGKAQRAWQNAEEILGRFGGALEDARQGYERFVAAGVELGRQPELVGGGLRRSAGAWLELPTRKGQREPVAHDDRVLGEPDFVLDLLADADWERKQLLKARTRAGIPELTERVAALAKVSVVELRSGARTPGIVAARRVLAQVAVRELGHSGAAVARYLGVATSTINRQAAAEGDLEPHAKSILKGLSP